MSHLINEILCGTYQHLSGIGMCVLTCVTHNGLQEDFVFFAMVILLFICILEDFNRALLLFHPTKMIMMEPV